MKKLLKKAFVTTAIITGAAVSLIPLTSYAEIVQTVPAHVAVQVVPAITLEVVAKDHQGSSDNEILFSPAVNSTDEATFSAIVSTNQSYTLSLSGLDGQTAMYKDGYTSATATADTQIPGTGQITAGQSSWGVKLASATNYSPVPSTVTEFYTGPDPVVTASTDFNIGMAIGPNLESGSYSGTLLITASNN